MYKVPSGEVTNIPMLLKIAGTAKPVILSTGMSNWAELDAAVQTLREGGPLSILQCSSAYPCPPERVGLNVIQEMRARYELPVGLSDHTCGAAAAVAAAALGATLFEKHIAFSRHMYGSDAKYSMEPAQFKDYVQIIREVFTMLAHPIDKDDLTPYEKMKKIYEKSIVAARDLKAGALIAQNDLAFKKPGDGISAARFRELIGKRLKKDIKRDETISLDALE
jgi:N-acetylneuraminate synthase